MLLVTVLVMVVEGAHSEGEGRVGDVVGGKMSLQDRRRVGEEGSGVQRNCVGSKETLGGRPVLSGPNSNGKERLMSLHKSVLELRRTSAFQHLSWGIPRIELTATFGPSPKERR